MQDKFRPAVQFAGAFVAATVVASIIGYFYYSPAVQIPNPDNFTELKLVTSDHNTQGLEGYGNITIDENGFHNIVGFPMREAQVLFIGSSQTEGAQVSNGENYVALLNAKYPELHGYNLGISASTFATTFIRMQPLKDNFPQARTLVFEINIMPTLAELTKMRDTLASGDIPAKNIDWKAKNPLVKLAARQPIPRLIYIKNLKDHASDPNAQSKKVAVAAFDATAYEQTLREVLSLGKNIAGDSKVVIFGLERLTLAPDGTAEIDSGHGESAIFARVCADLGISYVAMGPYFLESYREQHVLPYGYYNSTPNVGHLSIYGHQAIARALASKLGGIS